jgi:hypothetical protein
MWIPGTSEAGNLSWHKGRKIHQQWVVLNLGVDSFEYDWWASYLTTPSPSSFSNPTVLPFDHGFCITFAFKCPSGKSRDVRGLCSGRSSSRGRISSLSYHLAPQSQIYCIIAIVATVSQYLFSIVGYWYVQLLRPHRRNNYACIPFPHRVLPYRRLSLFSKNYLDSIGILNLSQRPGCLSFRPATARDTPFDGFLHRLNSLKFSRRLQKFRNTYQKHAKSCIFIYYNNSLGIISALLTLNN